MKNKLLLFSFLVTLVFFGCKGKEETPTYYVDKEMLRYCWFPEGSSWIYEEANTPGWVDSVYVTLSETGIYQDIGEGYNQEYYGNTLKIRGKAFGRQTIAWANSFGSSGSYSETTESYSDSLGQRIDYVFFHDTKGRDTLASYPNIFIQNRFDTIRIAGILYQNAIEVVTHPPTAADHTFSTIWVKDIGIIQRSMTDGTVWNLLRYRIAN